MARHLPTRPVLLALLALLFPRAAAPAPPPQWVSTWEAAPQLTEPANNPPLPLAGTTVRQVLRVNGGGGARLRVLFSNVFGSGPVTVLAAHVAASAAAPGAPVDSRIMAATDTALTFDGGAAGVTIAAGASAWSDAAAFVVEPLGNLAVTAAFGAAPGAGVSGHPGSRTTSFQALGADVSAPDMATAQAAPHWWVLAGLDVADGPATRACVVIGDSITDGRGSTTDGNNRWPDVLAARLLATNSTAPRGARNSTVVNAGIGGNAITGGGLGPTALERFARDVLGQSAVDCAVIFEGVNDIGAGVAASAVIAGLETLRAAAAAAGLRTVGATITPFFGNSYFSPTHEAARQAVNAHIRSSDGAFDAVIDFDEAVSDGGAPPRLKPEYDSGDGLHPNALGYAVMAAAVDLAIFDR